jgi:hypothetical protein
MITRLTINENALGALAFERLHLDREGPARSALSCWGMLSTWFRRRANVIVAMWTAAICAASIASRAPDKGKGLPRHGPQGIDLFDTGVAHRVTPVHSSQVSQIKDQRSPLSCSN